VKKLWQRWKMDKVANLIEYLTEFTEEDGMPRNVKLRIGDIIAILKEDIDLSIKVHKVSQILEELNEDSNIESHIRTELYGILPMLESL